MILGQADLTSNTNNLVVALDAAATCNILLVNRTTSTILVSVAIVPSGIASPANQYWIEYQVGLDGNQPLERFGIPLSTGDQVFAWCSSAGISVSVVGIAL